MKTILFVLSICFNVVFSQKLKSLLLTDNRKLTYYENVERKEISIEYKIGGLINIAATITDGLDKEIQKCDPINEETLNIRQIYTLRQEQARFAGILAELGQIFSTPLPSYSDSDNNTNVIKLESLFSNHSMVIAALTNDITQVQNYSLSDYKDDKENHHRFVVYGLNFIQGIYTEGGIAAARLLETIRQSLSYGSNIDLFPLLVEYNFIDLPSNSAAEEFSPQHCGSGTGNGTIICKYSYYQLSEPETLISLTPIAYNGVSLKEDTFFLNQTRDVVWPTFQGKILSFTNDDKQKECLEGLNQDNIDQVFNCPLEENSDHFTILENGGVLFNKLTPEIVRAISEQLYSGQEVNIDEPCILTFYGSLRFETPFGQTVSIMGRGPDYINSPRIDKHLERWVTQVDFLTGLTHFYTNFPNLVGAASIAVIAAVSLSALVYLIKLLLRCRKTKKYHEKKYVNFVRRYNRERDEKIKQQLRPILKR